MSRIIFCATVAFSCCGVQAFGQGYYSQPGAHYQLTASPQQSDIPNPFDFSNQPAPPSTAPQAELSNSFQDPDSIPGCAQPPERSIVDTMVDHSMLMNTPHASYEPVDWCQTITTPNPVAEMMLREYCVDGLWDGYEAQRAHLCAHMWHKLSGHGCGSCGSQCGCCGSQVLVPVQPSRTAIAHHIMEPRPVLETVMLERVSVVPK